MIKILIAFLVVGAVAGVAYKFYVQTQPVVEKSPETVAGNLIYQPTQPTAASTTTIGTGTAIINTFTPGILNDSTTKQIDVPMAGLLLLKDYLISFKTVLTPYDGIEFNFLAISDGVIRVTIINQKGVSVTLPTITLSALPIN